MFLSIIKFCWRDHLSHRVLIIRYLLQGNDHTTASPFHCLTKHWKNPSEISKPSASRNHIPTQEPHINARTTYQPQEPYIVSHEPHSDPQGTFSKTQRDSTTIHLTDVVKQLGYASQVQESILNSKLLTETPSPFHCPDFRQMKVKNRFTFLCENKFCLSCTREGCTQHHHPMLHFTKSARRVKSIDTSRSRWDATIHARVCQHQVVEDATTISFRQIHQFLLIYF